VPSRLRRNCLTWGTEDGISTLFTKVIRQLMATLMLCSAPSGLMNMYILVEKSSCCCMCQPLCVDMRSVLIVFVVVSIFMCHLEMP
jgi:hypothetical protein